MARIALLIIYLIVCNAAFAQDALHFYQKGMDAIKAEKYEEAIKNFDESIKLKNDEFVVWYNRGIVKSWLRRYEESIIDFNQTIILNPKYKKGYNSRGNSRQDITDYEGALADYDFAIKLDSQYIDAIYNRAELYQLLGNKELACKDFKLAYKLGDVESQRNVERCDDTTKSSRVMHSILRLLVKAENNKYGFSPDDPIKVGNGPKGGPANQRAYLKLLRDAQGKPIQYKRTVSCCPYKTPNAWVGGMALLDEYELVYLNEKGEKTTSKVYISFYDYEEPKILFGFKTVGEQ